MVLRNGPTMLSIYTIARMKEEWWNTIASAVLSWQHAVSNSTQILGRNQQNNSLAVLSFNLLLPPLVSPCSDSEWYFLALLTNKFYNRYKQLWEDLGHPTHAIQPWTSSILVPPIGDYQSRQFLKEMTVLREQHQSRELILHSFRQTLDKHVGSYCFNVTTWCECSWQKVMQYLSLWYFGLNQSL